MSTGPGRGSEGFARGSAAMVAEEYSGRCQYLHDIFISWCSLTASVAQAGAYHSSDLYKPFPLSTDLFALLGT